MMDKKRIEVNVPGVREKMEDWIAHRGGVRVWENINLSNPDAGLKFTPARTEAGEPYPKPHWSVAEGELITDISRFRFAKEQKEAARVKIAVRVSSNGLMLKLTDGSSARLRKKLDQVEEQYGISPCYHFEDDEAVVMVPVWED